jgi:septal ring factor EnvC (AmiA/AmiB activator)
MGEEPRASANGRRWFARGFFQRKSHYDLKATSVQNDTDNGRRWSVIPPRSSERGILTFSREKRVFPARMERMRRMMHKSEEIDQFQMLEDKVDSLIKMVTAMKRERESLLEKIHIQEEKIANLASEAEALKATRDKAKQSILSLLEKIEQIEIKA